MDQIQTSGMNWHFGENSRLFF